MKSNAAVQLLVLLFQAPGLILRMESDVCFIVVFPHYIETNATTYLKIRRYDYLPLFLQS